MDEARGWLIGLAVAAILGVGILVWGNIDPTPDAAEVGFGETKFSNSWEQATPNFAAGDVKDESRGGGNVVGWGKLTVQDLCLQEEIDLEQAQSRLETYGLAASPSLRIRELADSSDYKPSEVADILRGNEPGAECDDPDCDCDDHDSESSAEHEDSSSDGESEDSD